MFSTSTALAAGGIAILFYLLQRVSPKYGPDEPQPVPHTIPILGLLFSYAVDRRSVFRWGYNLSSSKPWSMLITGWKVYVFSQPNESSVIYRHSKTLDAGNFVRVLNTKWFGYSAKDAEIYHERRPKLHDFMATHLLKPENALSTDIKYYHELDRQFQELEARIDASPDGVVEQELISFVASLQGKASTNAYYGRALLEKHPTLIEDLVYFNKHGFWTLLVGVPAFLQPTLHRKRRGILKALREVAFEGKEGDDAPSLFMKALIREFQDWGVSKNGVCSQMMSIFHGVNANSIPNGYCALLSLLTVPDALPAIRSELQTSSFNPTAPSTHHESIPTHLPLLRSFVQEALRTHSNLVTFREVLEPTSIKISYPADPTSSSSTEAETRVFNLEKGAYINLATTPLHESPVYHPSPETFQIDRFMAKELGGKGENFTKGVRPFGGGVSYCPGRVFAEKQIMAFLAGVADRLEVEVIGGRPKSQGGKGRKEWKHPGNADLEVIARREEIWMRVRRRKV